MFRLNDHNVEVGEKETHQGREDSSSDNERAEADEQQSSEDKNAAADDKTRPLPKEAEPTPDTLLFAEPDETSDVILEVEGRELHFSRAVLAHYSPVFHRMFYSDFKEKGQERVPLPGKEFQSMASFFNVMFPRGPDSECPLSDGNLIELLTLADEYQVDEVKVTCQHYIGAQLAHYFHNFYTTFAKTPPSAAGYVAQPSTAGSGSTDPSNSLALKGSMLGQSVTKPAFIDKLLLYLWACDQFGLPAHRSTVKSLLISTATNLKDVRQSWNYPSLPPDSKIEVLETLCSKLDGSLGTADDVTFYSSNPRPSGATTANLGNGTGGFSFTASIAPKPLKTNQSKGRGRLN